MNRLKPVDALVGAVCAMAAVLSVGALLWIVLDLVKMGTSQIDWEFLTSGVEESGRAGGIGPVIKSTLLILMCCLLVAIPFGVGCAFWITEMVSPGSRLTAWLTRSVDLLASIPSIVFGLFGMAFFCRILGLGFSILSGGLTLACMILPILIRTTLAAVQSLPPDLRLSATAMGLRKSTILSRVLLPRAFPGILIGFTIGVARALSETAALIFTSGYATRSPASLLDSGRSISVHIFDMAMNVPNGATRASASALVLLLVILMINYLANYFSDQWLKKVN
ncbi:MAG: phosphate ABC transporter permease PstA [Verrucomicrobiales bacterium]|nr:phosphate ABC transporter permease PstA [Verrucomicrobiales bacterium]